MYKEKDGIMLVDKPRGPTSHDIVAFVRSKFCIKKVGHAGTLDPMATGLLILLLGSYTKKSLIFSGFDKSYEAELSLGVTTDTQDVEGRITKEGGFDKSNITRDRIVKVFSDFRGKINQLPPMYSAKKVKGRKLYEFARRGIALKREPRVVEIKDIKITDISLPKVNFFVTCSKGTYIRQLAHDIGEKIGCGAHLTGLRRTEIGPFNVARAVPLEALKKNANEVFYENILQPE